MNKVILFLEQQTEESINQLSSTVFYTTRVENKCEFLCELHAVAELSGNHWHLLVTDCNAVCFYEYRLVSLWVNPINKMIIYFNAFHLQTAISKTVRILKWSQTLVAKRQVIQRKIFLKTPLSVYWGFPQS